ncbi:MAG: hypothetical protein R3E48_13915 [Burkholderiaceae bacterium]
MITYARDHDTADGLDYIGIWNCELPAARRDRRGHALARRESRGRVRRPAADARTISKS